MIRPFLPPIVRGRLGIDGAYREGRLIGLLIGTYTVHRLARVGGPRGAAGVGSRLTGSTDLVVEVLWWVSSRLTSGGDLARVREEGVVAPVDLYCYR